MFNAIGEKTLYVNINDSIIDNWKMLTLSLTSYIFGAANVITIPMVWALYPETNQRTLEVRAFSFPQTMPAVKITNTTPGD